MKRDQTPANELRVWLDENSTAPSEWRALAAKLGNDHKLTQVWAQLRRKDIPILHFFSLVTTAHESAIAEMQREPEASESAKLARVIRLATELKAAIEESPMPRQSGTSATLTCDGLPAVLLLISMRDDLPANGWGMGHYPLSVTWMLDRSIELVKKHESGLPPRAVTRRRSRPEVAAFVRILVFLVMREFGNGLHSAVARVATSIFEMQDWEPLDQAGVQVILRDTPPAFSRPKDASASP